MVKQLHYLKSTFKKLNQYFFNQSMFPNASINVKPEGGWGGGGGTPGICGEFDLYCLPHPREFD